MEADRNEQGLSLALLQFNPSSVVLLDTDGRIRSLNRNAERLLSTTEADAVGKSYTVVFGESLSQRVFKLMLRGNAHGEARAIEATLPSGRRAKLRATAGPLKDARGNVNGIVFVLTRTRRRRSSTRSPISTCGSATRCDAISATTSRTWSTHDRRSSTSVVRRRP